MAAAFRASSRGSDHQHGLTFAHGLLVERHVDELVHERERHQAAQSGDDAVRGAGAVQSVGALGAAQDRDVPVGDAGRS